MFANIYEGKTVLVTGHTGFKGSWLSIWLKELGANVIGFSLPELPTSTTNFELTHLGTHITDIRGDIRDLGSVVSTIEKYKPEIIFHLAGQPIVFKAYDDPKSTFDINAGGTVNILEAVKRTDCVKAVVCITTDKVYKNNEWVWGYRETDQLGDKDPYSASKAMAELAIEAYRSSFFKVERTGGRMVAVASTRAGNVIGGGDFASFRLVPDSMKALMTGESIKIRNPYNVRPWQHVLEPLSGYLWLGKKLLESSNGGDYAKAWNFGPESESVTAGEIADILVSMWGQGSWINTGKDEAKHESGLLMLDCSAAAHNLKWRSIYNCKETLLEIVSWYKEYVRQAVSQSNAINMYAKCVDQIGTYAEKANRLGIAWSSVN